MKKYQAVIFDLDGTLLNTLEDLADSTNYALRQMNYPERTIDEVRRFVGNGVEKLMERAVPTGTSEDDTLKALAIFKKHYSKNMLNKTGSYEGVIDVLKVLKEKGIPAGIVSNKFDAAVKGLRDQFFWRVYLYCDWGVCKCSKETGTGHLHRSNEGNADRTGRYSLCRRFRCGYHDREEQRTGMYLCYLGLS